MDTTKQDRLKELQRKLADAVYNESAIRESAFLDIPYKIAGIPVDQLTPRKFIYLEFIDSPYVVNNDKMPEMEDTMTFIWICSKEYKLADNEAFEAFIDKHFDANFNWQQAQSDIVRHIEEAFLDSPPSSTNKKNSESDIPGHAWIADYIDILASEYGWNDQYILDMPIARLLQYIKVIDYRYHIKNGNTPTKFNKYSDAIKRQIQELMNEKG